MIIAILVGLHVVCLSVFGIAGHQDPRRPVERCMDRIVTMSRISKSEGGR
jgi:hypothetical protein